MASKIKRSDILSLLKLASPVSGETLAKRLRVSRQALHKQIRVLRVQGYPISGKPKSGYVLDSLNDVVIPEEVEKDFAQQKVGRRILYFPEIGSTQDACKELALRGEPEGAVVIAERQTGGRGRMGRPWISDKGGLWVSVLFRPALAPQDTPAFTLAASMAIADAIAKECAIRPEFKWPNDLWVNVGSLQHPIYKKICGVLAEMSAEADRLDWIALGLGVNVNNPIRHSLKNIAANLKSLTGESVRRQNLLSAILKNLQNAYDAFLQNGFGAFKESYLERCVLRNKWITLKGLDAVVQGEFAGIDSQGALELRLADGSVRKFFAGDVTFEPLALTGSKN